MVFEYITSGESHGKMLTAVINHVPAGFKVDTDFINKDLKRRQSGYGRGGRMQIETDKVEIVAGVRKGETTGSPVCLIIENKDYKNWENKEVEDFTRPRPGHADLVGGRKYRRSDLRDILERASARETAIRVAVGSFAKSILGEFGIQVRAFVTSIGGIEANAILDLSFDEVVGLSEKSLVGTADNSKDGQIIELIDKAKTEGDTLGGTIRVVCHNVPPMLGSFAHYAAKLDAQLAASLMSIQAIKGVSFGLGFSYAKKSGKASHDQIFYTDEKGFYYKSNNAGRIEGGMSNGNDILIDCVMKPIPTLMTPLKSVDIKTKEPFDAVKERSDVCAVPACAVVAECVASIDILRALGDAFGADNIHAMKKALEEALKYNF